MDFEQDSLPSDGSTARIAELAQRQLDLEAQIAEKEQELKVLNDDLRQVSEKHLPEALLNAGVEEIKLANGFKVSVKEDLSVSVGKERMSWVCAWLRQSGHDDIIKSEVVVSLPKGTDAAVIARLQSQLNDLGVRYTSADNVHTQTLKALLKEQRERGVDIDLKQFGAYPWRKSQIKLPK